jgi:hypothetical protein
MATQLQIAMHDGRKFAVTPGMFASWTGRRFKDGEEYHGAVVVRDRNGDGHPYTGSRVCDCALCQEFVVADCKPDAVALRGPKVRK